MGKYLFVVLFIAFMVIGDVNGGWARKAWRKVKKHVDKVKNTVEKVGQTVATVKAVSGLLSAVGKRSTDKEMSRIDLCYFESMDLDGDKILTEDEVQVLIDMYGVPEINGLFELLDQDNDGKIDQEDYREVINYCIEEKIVDLSKKLSKNV